MATKTVSGTNAAAKKPRGKPFTSKDAATRGKPFSGADDPRRSNAGQRSREVVQTQAQARALYVQVLHEPIGQPPDPTMSNLEMIVRQHVAAAKKGDAQQREQMFDRIWGKATEKVDTTVRGTLSHEHTDRTPATPEAARNLSDSDLAQRIREALGESGSPAKRW